MSDHVGEAGDGSWAGVDGSEVLGRFRTLVDAIDDGVAVLDGQGRVVAVDGTVLEVTGHARDALRGTRLTGLFDDDVRPRVEAAIEGRPAEGDPQSETLELPVRTVDGEAVPVELDFEPLVEDGTRWGTACVLRTVGEAGASVDDGDGRPEEGDSDAGTPEAGDPHDEDAALGELAAARRTDDSEFRTMVENLEHVVWMTTGDLREVLFVNRAFEEVYGRDRERLYEDPEVLLEAVHPADRERARELLDREVTEPHAVEYRIVRPDGEVRWIHDSATPVFDDDGDVARIVGTATDVTRRKEREAELQRNKGELETLFEVLPVGVVVAEADGEIVEANDVAHDIWGGDVFDAASVEEYEKYPVRWADSGEEVPPEEMTLARVVDGEAVTDPDVFEFDAYDGERRVVELLGMPIRDGSGEVIRGVVTMNDVTERYETQRRLEESERRYRTLVENFPEGSVGMFDEELRYTAVGGQLLDRLDVDPEDRVGRSISEIHPEGIVEEVEPYFEAALEGEANSFEMEYRGRHLRANTLPIEDAADEVFAGMLVVQDVTDRREMEQDLRESEARFRMLAENLEEIVWMATPDAEELIYLNPAFEDVWGMDRERLYEDSMAFLEAVHEEDRERVREQFERLPESDFEAEYRIVRPDGEVRWVYARGSVVSEGGTTRVVGIGEDVTERKEREREFERALDLLDRTERIADVGGWEIDPETQEVFWTEHVFDLLEMPTDEEPPLEEALDMYHEDDREAVERAVEEALETGEPFDEEARIRTAGGEVRWLWLQGVPEVEDGEVVSFRGAVQDVTERKERERELERALDLLNKTERIADVAGWEVDPETGEPYWSDHLFNLLDVDYDDQPTLDQALDVYYSDEDRAIVEDAVEEALETGEPFDVETRFPRPDGDVGWLRVKGDPEVEDGEVVSLRGAVQDVTERKEREKALQESRNQLRALVDVLPVAVFVAEADGEIVEWNEAAEEIWGGEVVESESVAEYDEYEAWWADTGEPVDPEEWPLARALEGEEVTDPDEIRIKGFDGKLRTVLNHGMPVRDADGEVTRAVVTLVDITERKEYQRKLEESNERLEQFAYAASHDLQEPLRMVSSYLQLLENRYADELDEDGEEFIEFAVDGADRMREMIEALLAYSRVETRGDPLEAVDLEAVFEEAREDLKLSIAETDAEITVEELPRVEGDASQLRQVFQNLLDNAIEYSGDEPPEIHVGADRAGDRWLVSVADEGIGIDPDDQDDVFEVFQRLHSREDHEGTGIGLALCERIVERHDGRIWVESEPGEGSTFYFTLPAVNEEDA